jgi:hypothetical protein
MDFHPELVRQLCVEAIDPNYRAYENTEYTFATK